MAFRLPNMSALALHPHASVPTGAPKKKARTTSPGSSRGSGNGNKTGRTSPGPDGDKNRKKPKTQPPQNEDEARDERGEEIRRRIDELLKKGVEGDEPRAGWEPRRDDQVRVIDPAPAERCCTGGALSDQLPEGLRVANATAAPAAPRVIEDPEAWAAAQQAEKEQALQMRMSMSEEEWNATYGDKRRASVENIKKSLNGYKRYRHHVPLKRRQEFERWHAHPVTPDANDRRYSKRGWAGAVRKWTELVQQSWGTEGGGGAHG
jgi:hypothetical protein